VPEQENRIEERIIAEGGSLRTDLVLWFLAWVDWPEVARALLAQ